MTKTLSDSSSSGLSLLARKRSIHSKIRSLAIHALAGAMLFSVGSKAASSHGVIEQHGFADFSQGTLGDSGVNLYVSKDGKLQVINQRDFNGDGYNDFWNPIGLNYMETSVKVQVFDRYGKLIKELNALGNGWNGTFNGDLLPTDDYWFIVTLTNEKTYRGHFTLKR